MELLPLVFGPALLALGALVWSMRLARHPNDRPQSAARLLGSFVLLLIAFGIGTCYAGMFAAMPGSHDAPALLQPLAIVSLLLLTGMAAGYILKIHRLTREDEPLVEAFEVEAPARVQWLPILLVALISLLAGSVLFFNFYFYRG